MGRKPRVHFSGALYHVISRGNQRQALFRSDRDRSRYLELLSHYQKRYEFRLYAYVLMGNHIHLLLEAGEIGLPKIMQGLQQSYTLYFNHKYGLLGHLFQGRYKAFLCDRDSYLLELVRYIHLNPVRSKLTKDPALYHWSSHRSYLGEGSEDCCWVDTAWVLSQFSRNRSAALRRYRQFVLEGIGAGHREDLYAVKEQRYLGNDDFVERVSRKVQTEEARPIRVTLNQIEEAVRTQYDLSLEQLRSRSKERRGSFGRLLVAYLGRRLGATSLNDVGKRYGRDQVSLSLGLKRLEQEIVKDADLRQSVDGLMVRLGKRGKLNN